ncbi:MAG: SMI1/KNR4 family protein [Planctomycetes bacterium]|nr:SMI1/KNR4 family protein [Planctomycetota bacterium]
MRSYVERERVAHLLELRPGPPATAEKLRAFEDHVGVPLPAAYRAFLEIHDGYHHLLYPGSFYSIADLLPGGAAHAKVVEWKRMCSDYGNGEVLDGLVVANTGQPNNWAYFDPDQVSPQGDPALVSFTPSDSEAFPDLLEFLRNRIAFYEIVISPDDDGSE